MTPDTEIPITRDQVIVIHSDSDDGTALPLEFQSKSQKRISKKLQKAEEARLLNLEQVKQITKAIKEQVREFKASIRTKNMTDAQRVADEMIKAYGSVSLQPWQHILHTLYPLDCKFARDFVYKGRTILAESNLLREFDKICAVMECEHGDPKIGEKLFKGLLQDNPKALGVVVAYARQLLIKKRFADAGLLFERYMRAEPQNSVAAKKQLNMLEVEFKRKIL